VIRWHGDVLAEEKRRKAEAWDRRLEALKRSDMEVGDPGLSDLDPDHSIPCKI
jgi:hypothetical protein